MEEEMSGSIELSGEDFSDLLARANQSEREAAAFRWLEQMSAQASHHEDGWYIHTMKVVGFGSTMLKAVEDAMRKEAGK